MSASSASGAVPPELPGYRFIEHIGTGGNARVYLYEQELPQRKVAVKVLNESALTEAARRRFIAEANVTADLAHRHIVQVFDAKVTADGRPYIVMPYYSQPNMSVRARRSHFSVADVLRIGIQVGSAVETSHRRGVLHRDIKPQNILTDAFGDPALTDFGIATTKGGDEPEGMSLPWSPPEILYGTSPGDERSDVYSLGATLWHLLAGRSPFEQPGGDNSRYALLGRIKSDQPPRTARADVPDSLERLLRQAMAKDPAARPQSAMELILGLQSVEQELRLSRTPPVLPVGGVQEETLGRDTVAIPRAPGGPGGPMFAPGPAAPARPFVGPVPGGPVLGGTGGGGPAEDDPTRRGGPARLDPLAAGPAPRSREFPPEVREGTTTLRPAALDPGGGPVAAAAKPDRPRGRVLALVGAAVAAVVAVLVLVLLGSSHGQQATTSAVASQPASAGGQGALGPGATAPGEPVVSAQRTGTGKVRFTWTYANPVSGDIFHYQAKSAGAAPVKGVTGNPMVTISGVKNQDVCLVVQVVRADGQASPDSQPACLTP